MDTWLVVSTPLKNISQLGLLFPIYGKIKNVPNHQPNTNSPIAVYRIPTGKINNGLANNTGYTMSNCIVLVA